MEILGLILISTGIFGLLMTIFGMRNKKAKIPKWKVRKKIDPIYNPKEFRNTKN